MAAFTRLLLTSVLGAAACIPATGYAGRFDCLPTHSYSASVTAFTDSTSTSVDICLNTFDGVSNLLNEASLAQVNSSYNADPYFMFRVAFLTKTEAGGFEYLIRNDGTGFGPPQPPGSKLYLLGTELQGIYNIIKVFDGGTVDESLKMIINFLRHDKDFMRAQARYLAEKTPDSSITGPNGLIPSTAAAELDSAVENTLNEIDANSLESAGLESTLINFSASTGHITVAGKTADITSLPLSYTWRSNTNRGRMFSLSGSLARISATHDTTTQFGLGVTYRLPVTESWALTPSLRYSGTQSDDLASSIGLITAGLSSTYHIPYKKLNFVIGNTLGYHKTTDIIDLGKYAFNPEIKSWSARNGLTLAQPVNFFNVPLSIEYSLADTRYFGGTDFYVDNTQELGLSLGTNRRADATKKYIRFGLRYLHGRETHGLSLTGGYWF
jgi:hypothetical protein